MFTHQADYFADESWSGTCTYAYANKVKMCHNTKVNMSLCHLGKAVARAEGGGGGQLFLQSPSLHHSFPPCSDTNSTKIIEILLRNGHSESITAEICQQIFFFFTVRLSSFVNREISCYSLNANQSMSSYVPYVTFWGFHRGSRLSSCCWC